MCETIVANKIRAIGNRHINAFENLPDFTKNILRLLAGKKRGQADPAMTQVDTMHYQRVHPRICRNPHVSSVAIRVVICEFGIDNVIRAANRAGQPIATARRNFRHPHIFPQNLTQVVFAKRHNINSGKKVRIIPMNDSGHNSTECSSSSVPGVHNVERFEFWQCNSIALTSESCAFRYVAVRTLVDLPTDFALEKVAFDFQDHSSSSPFAG